MPDHDNPRPGAGPRRLPRRPAVLAAIGAGLLALGGATGAVVTAETRPSVSMAPARPVAIHSLSSTGIVTLRGRVAEVYGNKFVIDDGTGRALIDTGREGDRRTLVSVGMPVTVQGRYDGGFMHAAFLVGPDDKVLSLGPLAGPPHGPHDRPDRDPDPRAAPVPVPGQAVVGVGAPAVPPPPAAQAR